MDQGTGAMRDMLGSEIAAAMRRAEARYTGGTGTKSTRPAAPASQERPCDREPFGQWLAAQRDRGDWIDRLADAARRDPGFPKRGTPAQVRDRLRAMGADGDAFEQADDAERCWRSL